MAETLGSRTVCILLALTLTGLSGFVHPVLCLESDGRVRLEMDASRCCAGTEGPHSPDGPTTGPASASPGCGDCTDIHFSARGTRPAAGSPFALGPATGAHTIGAHDGPSPFPVHQPDCPDPSPPPPSNLRC